MSPLPRSTYGGEQIDPETVGSPFKRHRASVPGLDPGMIGPIGSNTNEIFGPPVGLGTVPPPPTPSQKNGDQSVKAQPTSEPSIGSKLDVKVEEEDEEL